MTGRSIDAAASKVLWSIEVALFVGDLLESARLTPWIGSYL